ncbi:hypothetical protein BG005_005447 [Podila minutissima]|nr:hypothetical protein BG005_005447 [Podila minutissima]
MAKLNLLLASVASLTIAVNSADASFAICVGKTGKPFAWVTGYYLWNEGSDNSHHYDSFGPFTGRAKLGGQNGWSVHVQNISPTLVDVYVYNNNYSFGSKVEVETVCTDEGLVVYGCYSNTAGWCDSVRQSTRDMCSNHIEMGSDSLSCK